MAPLAQYVWFQVGNEPLLAQRQGGAGNVLSGNTLWLVLLFGALIVALAFFAIFARYFRLWIQSVTTGAGIGILDLLRMTFRKVNPTVITRSKIMAVQAGIYDKFVEGVAARAKALKVGNALDSTTQMGPAVTDTQLAGNLKYVDIAIKEGGRLLAGGAEPLKLATPGHYMSPTLIVDTKIGDTINQEEVFGPVVSVVKIKDYEEGLAHSNSGNFGLSAGIVTTSLKHARHYQRNVKAGMVMINLPTAGVDYHVPFGGSRGSSYGNREQGFAAVEFFTQIKTAYSLS